MEEEEAADDYRHSVVVFTAKKNNNSSTTYNVVGVAVDYSWFVFDLRWRRRRDTALRLRQQGPVWGGDGAMPPKVVNRGPQPAILPQRRSRQRRLAACGSQRAQQRSAGVRSRDNAAGNCAVRAQAAPGKEKA